MNKKITTELYEENEDLYFSVEKKEGGEFLRGPIYTTSIEDIESNKCESSLSMAKKQLKILIGLIEKILE